ncbi:phage tail-collar fiber domain-containing protein [Photobacterium leiognathi]|uniref:phage tail-collar fiber domain-containing protein n=1 Tax=Photobacterium leiognathi TaxID=553611 RepID=UPI00298228E0|nr:phage tail protein [Photobacterium leiognathi]
MSSSVVLFTQAGLAELISTKNEGLKGTIKWIAAGDKSYQPTPTQTGLLNEKQRERVSDWEMLSPTQLRMAAVFKGDLEYEVREVGFFLDTGTLLAVYSVPDTLLAYKSANASWLQKFTLDISPLPSNSVTIDVGTDNMNLLLGEELSAIAAAQIGNMSRHLSLLFRFNDSMNKPKRT